MATNDPDDLRRLGGSSPGQPSDRPGTPSKLPSRARDDDDWPPPMLRSPRPTGGMFGGLKLHANSERVIFAVLGWCFVVAIVIAVIDPLTMIQRLSRTPATGDANPALAMLGVMVTVLVFGVLVLLGIRAILRLRDRP